MTVLHLYMGKASLQGAPASIQGALAAQLRMAETLMRFLQLQHGPGPLPNSKG